MTENPKAQPTDPCRVKKVKATVLLMGACVGKGVQGTWPGDGVGLGDLGRKKSCVTTWVSPPAPVARVWMGGKMCIFHGNVTRADTC